MLFALLLAPLASCAEPPRFDYYLLALSVAPAFCEDEPRRKRNYAQCRALSGPAFASLPLTLHGLWPNRTDRRHPSFCNGEPPGGFCRLPKLDLPADTRTRLARVMPGAADCLDRYQWAKHGSCSGMREADYFAASAALTERVNRALGGEIARHAGREVSLAVLREALSRADPALVDAVSFDCRTPRTPDPAKRRPMLREVRVHFERDPATGRPGEPMAYTRAGHRHYNSGCPGGRAYIDSPLD
jgi:ribonuclease T2